MTLEQAMFEALGQFPGLSALVGPRIFPGEAPQGTGKPYVVWQDISTVSPNDLDGSAATGGVDNIRVQVTAYATKALQAADIRRQVALAMQAATAFRSLDLDKRSLPFEPDTKLFGSQADFSVWLPT